MEKPEKDYLIESVSRLISNHPPENFVSPEIDWFENLEFQRLVGISRRVAVEQIQSGIEEGAKQGDFAGIQQVLKHSDIALIGFVLAIGLSMGWEARKSFVMSEEAKKIVGENPQP